MHIKLLFLDLNGTCVDDWEAVYLAVNAVFDHYGIDCPPMENFIRTVAQNGDYLSFYRNHGITASREDLYKIYLPVYKEHTPEVVVMDSIHDSLDMIQRSGVEIHILTAARKDLACRLIEMADIGQYCEAFHYHVHNKHAQIEAIIDGMDIEPHECAMMGDLPSDVVHAKRAGIKGIAFENRHVPRDIFDGIEDIDYVASSFPHLARYIIQ